MGEKSIEVLAPAKINLALAVSAKRADGYHSLETVFQSISLVDRVKVTLKKSRGISCFCGDLSGEKNLAYQAARLFVEQCQVEGLSGGQAGIEIAIEKKIPVQAGLAGGSSDAASVLRALNILFSCPFSYDTLLELAKKCGSDAAFCLKGGTQWGEGTGTDLKDLPPAPEMDILLVKPSRGISTAEAFRIYDEIGEYSALNMDLWVDLLKAQDRKTIAMKLSNSLEKAAFRLLPELIGIKELLLRGGCLGALMSGSGSAVFGIVQNQDKGKEIAELLMAKGISGTWLVKTTNELRLG